MGVVRVHASPIAFTMAIEGAMLAMGQSGSQTLTAPTQAAQLEDGLGEEPFLVIGGQTIWGT